MSNDARKVKPSAEAEEDAAGNTSVDASTEKQSLIPRIRYFARSLNQLVTDAHYNYVD